MLERSKWHPTITEDVVSAAVQRHQTSLDNPGFCLVCGLEQEGCEPDAQGITCESCGAEMVAGAAELLIIMVV